MAYEEIKLHSQSHNSFKRVYTSQKQYRSGFFHFIFKKERKKSRSRKGREVNGIDIRKYREHQNEMLSLLQY